MNEVIKAIFERNSCRDFSGEPVSRETMELLSRAALAAPSAMNNQPWRIICVLDKTLLDEMDKDGMQELKKDEAAYERIKARGGKLFYNAPAAIIVLTDKKSAWGAHDSGILIQNVALAAHSLGLGNVICGMARIPLEAPNSKWRERLGFGEFPDFDFVVSILIGKANSGKTPHELDALKVKFI